MLADAIHTCQRQSISENPVDNAMTSAGFSDLFPHTREHAEEAAKEAAARNTAQRRRLGTRSPVAGCPPAVPAILARVLARAANAWNGNSGRLLAAGNARAYAVCRPPTMPLRLACYLDRDMADARAKRVGAVGASTGGFTRGSDAWLGVSSDDEWDRALAA